MQSRTEIFHLRRGGTSVVLDTTSAGLPSIVHWGEDLGALSDSELEHLVTATLPQRVSGGLDVPARLSLLPQDAFGWQGTPGLSGSRRGLSFSPALVTSDVVVSNGVHAGEPATGQSAVGVVSDSDAAAATITAIDPMAGLTLHIELALTESGLLTQQLTLANTGDGDYDLTGLAATFPLPATATEILDSSGRHLRERTPQRHAFTIGRHERESRTGRPGADATLLLCAGTPGFGFEGGLVHAVHLAWSGNHRLSAERSVSGHSMLQASELLLPGEVRLAPGERYSTPVAIASWGHGLTELSGRLHQMLRARPNHPSRPRPITLNTWEAVYFDLDLERLKSLADAAAAVGAERYVLDDGWFRGRRDDTSGLGDWFVDESIWPDGLKPLIDHVTGLGLEFGLWVEPEMVNPDSDLARAHPEWMLQAAGRLPVEGRQQQVLDLSHREAAAYILERLDALVTEYPIAYLKWDHNRDLADAGNTATGAPAVHNNVVALYSLLDELRTRHPGLEIESCASGGARIDLGILDHTDRIWTSDCIDPIERLTIQKYTNLLVPYELMGAHVSGPQSHSTGRTLDLDLRAGVAMFGHFGIEWDISRISPDELADLASWVAAHKTYRSLLHTGRAVFADVADPSVDLRGVVAQDRGRALYAATQATSSGTYPGGALLLPGLDDDRRYTVRLAEPQTTVGGNGQSSLKWAEQPITLTGRALRTVGVRMPVIFPQHLILIDVTDTTPEPFDVTDADADVSAP
jgi:alpha-galactosidase